VRVAFLRPDTPKADQFEGESTIYVDDFEGSQSTIDMRSPYAWSLHPHQTGMRLVPMISNSNDLSYGFKRAKLVGILSTPFLCPKTLWDF
jgi:cell surface protein SprA